MYTLVYDHTLHSLHVLCAHQVCPPRTPSCPPYKWICMCAHQCVSHECSSAARWRVRRPAADAVHYHRRRRHSQLPGRPLPPCSRSRHYHHIKQVCACVQPPLPPHHHTTTTTPPHYHRHYRAAATTTTSPHHYHHITTASLPPLPPHHYHHITTTTSNKCVHACIPCDVSDSRDRAIVCVPQASRPRSPPLQLSTTSSSWHQHCHSQPSSTACKRT